MIHLKINPFFSGCSNLIEFKKITANLWIGVKLKPKQHMSKGITKNPLLVKSQEKFFVILVVHAAIHYLCVCIESKILSVLIVPVMATYHHSALPIIQSRKRQLPPTPFSSCQSRKRLQSPCSRVCLLKTKLAKLNPAQITDSEVQSYVDIGSKVTLIQEDIYCLLGSSPRIQVPIQQW